MHKVALFPGLLGERFPLLHPHVQALHAGGSSQCSGTATVQRGANFLLRIAAAVAGLPTSQREVPTRVTIDARDGKEVWTRQFGTAAPMVSTLCAREGLLVEQLGPVTMHFGIAVLDGGMCWELQRIAFLALPLPARMFHVVARAEGGVAGYRFLVAVRMKGVGELIRYEGELDVAT